MTENDLFAWLITHLGRLMIDFGAPHGLELVRGFQTTQQGRTDDPTLYLARQNLKQYGSPRDSYEIAGDGGSLKHVNSQVVELQIQFQALITYDPQTGLRVGDLLNLASRIMGMPKWRQMLRDIGVQTFRIPDNALTYTRNDRDQYEAVPVLLATFIYTETLTTSVPVVTSFTHKVRGI